MSVDKLRETHHINRVAPSDLGLLMSAQSYRPEITQAIRKIKSFPWAPLQSLVKNVISPGPHPAYGGTYPCLKTKNVNELLADLQPADFADVNGINNLEKVQVERGDLLINLTGAGSIGRVSIYYGDDLPITNQHIARMGIKAAYDEGYVAAFLRTWWGERALEQGVAGSTGQINMVNDHVRSIPVIIFNPSVQKYIGDKVRQAERLRAGGKLIHSRVLDSFESLLGHYDKQNKSFERVSPDLLVDRLDQNHYKTSLLSCLKLLQLQKHVSLADKKYFAGLTDGDHGNPKYGDGPIYLRASEMTGGLISIDSVVRIDPEYAKGVSISCWAKADDIIFSVVGTLGLTAIVDLRTAGLMSRGVAKIASNILPNYYVKAFFKTHYFQAQLERHSVGSVQRGVYLSALEQIIVPILEQSIIEEIAESEMLADDMVKAATVLTTAAKLLVEALIEGQLTEAELIAAEQALQSGNNQLDRRILNRLKAGGVDGQGPALFGDLDELYHLLTQAEGD